ncbi:heme oxygenase (biliverdin-producing) [Rothia sp. P13129]|uniref:biliverdin-producing heme oxygenase n=1 Tax=Rothia sp. P13129 TaxID=3402664 RepID=UPI003AD15FD0
MNATATIEIPAEKFSARLKRESEELHSTAEHSGFMTKLMKGELSEKSYLRLLNQYVYLYEALEKVAQGYREAGNKMLEPFNQPELARAERIRADIKALGQEDIDPALPATTKYAQRILDSAQSPERFLSHHYLRYLGDLSGGQAVAVLMGRHYGISSEALSMYRFDELPKPKIFKDSYRTLLDNAPLSEEERQNVVDETLRGFQYNAELFSELMEQESH